MKFMKLGTRPDTFFTADSVRCRVIAISLRFHQVLCALMVFWLCGVLVHASSSRSVCTEVATDLQILVDNCLYHLHKVIN